MQEYSSKQYDDQEYEGHVKLNITMSHQVLRHNDNWYSPICRNMLQNSVITSYLWESFYLDARVCKLVLWSNSRKKVSTEVLIFRCLSEDWDKANIDIPLWKKNSIDKQLRYILDSSNFMLFFVGSHALYFFGNETLVLTLECLNISNRWYTNQKYQDCVKCQILKFTASFGVCWVLTYLESKVFSG